MDRERAVARLRALGEPNRLGLCFQLVQGELGGGELLRASRLSQPSLSRHIRVLREAGVIRERWVGRNAYYRLSDDPLTRGIVGILGGVAPSSAEPREAPAPDPINMSTHESETDLPEVEPEPEAPDPPPAPMEDWLL